MKILLFLIGVMVISVKTDEGESTKSLWDHVIKMEQVILSAEYHGRRLNVWREDAHGYSRFYVTPLCVLESSSVKCVPDEYSNDNRYAFSFNIKLWDSAAANFIQLAMEEKNISVNPSDIIPLPMQMVRLNAKHTDITEKIKLDNQWRSHHGQSNAQLFEFAVYNRDFCNVTMVNDVKNDPTGFLARTKLYLEFSMFVGQQSSRVINITGKTVGKSKVFADLVNDYGSKDGIVHLTSEDANNLAKDLFKVALINEEVTGDYIPSGEEQELTRQLFNEIKGDQVLSTELSKDEWNSVFWNDIFSRPDVQTEYFNTTLFYDAKKNHFIYNKENDKEFRKKTEDIQSSEGGSTKQGSGGFNFLGLFGVKGGGGTNSQSRDDISKKMEEFTKDGEKFSEDKLEEFIKDEKANVKWTGTRFEPKSLKLHRINTRALEVSNEIFYKRIVTNQISKTQELQIIPEPEFYPDYNKTLNPTHFEVIQRSIKSLQDTLAANTEKYDMQFNNVNSLINAANILITENTNSRNHAHERITALEGDQGNTKGRLTTLIECSHALGQCGHLPLAK